MSDRNRWFALYVLCSGVLMIVLDTTIVTVALPSIQADLGFSGTSLVWAERAQAMGIYGFVCAAGGSIGEVLGGFLTNLLGWESIFLVNLPIGIAVFAGCRKLIPPDPASTDSRPLDIGGAITVTVGLMLAVYAVVDGNRAGWTSAQTLALFGASASLLLLFLAIEARVREPLMPLRFGIRGPLWIGLLIGASGLALFARAPVDGSFVVDVLPGMLLLGLGAGMAFNPVLLAAMNDAQSDESGLASGIVNTSFMMGGALGLAVLVSLADARTNALQGAGTDAVVALNRGYQLAFLLGAIVTAAAALLSGVMLRPKSQPAATQAVAETP